VINNAMMQSLLGREKKRGGIFKHSYKPRLNHWFVLRNTFL